MDILTNKQYKTYNKVSRYSPFPIFYNTMDGTYQGSITDYLLDTTTFIKHLVNESDTLDTLALYYYGNPTYFWVIADFNRIQDPFEKLKVGEFIKVPTFSDIQFNV